jgi:hypothetical protein
VNGISVKFLRALFTQLHLTGFIGEVVLQASGLSYLFQKEETTTLRGRVRALLRGAVAEGVGLTSVAE